MNNKITLLPEIPAEQVTPLVRELLEIFQKLTLQVEQLKEENQKLKDEIALLKKGNPRPKVPPSKLEKETQSPNDSNKRSGSAKRSKTKDLKIHHVERIKPNEIPQGSILKDVQSFVVQDIRIENHNVLYELERWEGPDGRYCIGKLPENIMGHFGPTLISYILYQYYGALVTRPILLEQLHEFGVEISRGQLNNILIQGKLSFHQEKSAILTMGLKSSNYIQADDTKARHAGKNGFCTVITNRLFTWFASTGSKSRVNFLSLLQGDKIEYKIDEEALSYIAKHREMGALSCAILSSPQKIFTSEYDWLENLKNLGVTKPLEVRIATEGALLGHLISQGVPKDLAILSDDAGQFNVFDHFLCWIHEERHLKEVIPYNEQNRREVETVLDRFWNLYRGLKDYQQTPLASTRVSLDQEFDSLFKHETTSIVFNRALRNIYDKKEELLKVLRRPDVPLHNNGSEQEIREYVKRRKISGGTRSATGKLCRDTFTSLKKTCHKLGISFWAFIRDRVAEAKLIEYLPYLIQKVSIQPVIVNT